ncbi:alpha carbonic anhydrase 7-like [Fagus crenata]
MKLQSKSIFISNFLIVVILFSTTTSVTAQEVEDEREFDYIEGSKKGTEYWGELKEERSACKDGSMQSPVDISSQTVEITPTLLEVKSSYKPGNATVKNKGHDISLQWAGNAAGSIEINGTEYFLQQCHWHSPSEHTFDGRRYDLELQMVHKSLAVKAENKIVVVGVFYNIGEPDAFPSKLMGDIMSISDQTEERNVGLINPTEIKTGGDNSYYTFMGSLTVPPCTEGVIWIIHKTLSSVSGEQVQSLREAVHDYAEMNARPVQPLHARKIHLHNA